jgi:hypothetical protein
MSHVQNGNRFIGADGVLMPARKGQKPSDLKYFDKPESKGCGGIAGNVRNLQRNRTQQEAR